MNKNISLKFNENLLKCSHSDNLESAKHEFYRLEEFSFHKKALQCLCGRLVKHVNYMYNIHNKNVVVCGCVCYRKCNIKDQFIKCEILSKTLKKVLKRVLKKSKKYEKSPEINMDEYLSLVKSSLLSALAAKLESIITDTLYASYRIVKLSQLLTEINTLGNYGYNYFNDVVLQIDQHIIDLSDEIRKEKLMMKVKNIFQEWHKLANNKMFDYVELLKQSVSFGKYKNKTYGELCNDFTYCDYLSSIITETKEKFQKENIFKIIPIVKDINKYKNIERLMIKNDDVVTYKKYEYIN
jgi:hypothetical protein